MRRVLSAAGLAALVLGVSACGGYASAPVTPDNPSAPPADAIVIDIIGIDGPRSFSPNPATLPAGQAVVWHNRDTATHRVMLDNGSVDTGDIKPGGFSGSMTLPAAGPYHCSIHPVMVGAVVRGQ